MTAPPLRPVSRRFSFLPASREGWFECLSLALFGAAVLATWRWAGDVPIGLLGMGWVFLLGMFAFLARQGWFSLCGPVFFYDLVRTTRRSRFLLYRIYAYFILTLVGFFYMAWHMNHENRPVIHAREVSTFAETFFYTFMSLQLGTVAILTPAYIGGVLAQEKDRRTLEYLFATDLRNREIILGTVLARLANLFLMLLTGLPILSFVQFMGGVEPDLILAGFAIAGVSMVSLAGLAILCSVYARKPREAIVNTYLATVGYLILSGMSKMLFWTPMVTWNLPIGENGISVADFLRWFNDGNPIIHLLDLTMTVATSGRLTTALWVRVGEYAGFHLTVGVLLTLWAMARLRAVYLKQADGPDTGRKRGQARTARRAFADWPMIWKEVVVERGIRFRRLGRIIVLLLVVGSLAPLGMIYYQSAKYAMPQAVLVRGIGAYSRIMGATVACLLLIAVAVRASTAITGERDRHTLDNLLTTPLGSTAILGGKWIGSITSVRLGWLWLGLIWAVGLILGDVHWVSFPLQLIALAIYAGVLSVLGLYFSLHCSTSKRATVATVFSTLAVGIGFLMVPIDWALPTSPGLYGRLEWADYVYRYQMGLTPGMVLGRLLPVQVALGTDRPTGLEIKEYWEWAAAAAGLGSWLLGGVILGAVTDWRFRKLALRQRVRRPDLSPAPALAEPHPPVANQAIA